MFFPKITRSSTHISKTIGVKNINVHLLRLMSTTERDDYQFLQRSKLPTMHFQASLPRLPIPLLERTCDRFLEAVHPILDDNEFQMAQKSILDFRHNIGMELQTLLKQKDKENKHTSYISELWFDMYLRDRAPLPLNYNPLVVLTNDDRDIYQKPIIRSTNMIISSLRFWKSLRAGFLDPEVYHLNPKKSDTVQFRKWMGLVPNFIATYAAYAFKAFPLDMSQYQRLFGVSRVPMQNKDILVEFPESKHILVIRRGNMYAIDVLDKDGNILSPHTIHSRLQAVVELDATEKPAEFPLGVLTTTTRDIWADARQHLIALSNENRSKIENEVDGALFCLCIDSELDPVYNAENPEELYKNFLAGSGRNRWFDKSISLLVANDGTTAINFEHSWGDGVAVLRYLNEIYKETINTPFVHDGNKDILDKSEFKNVRPIKFHIDDKIRCEVNSAIQNNESTMKKLNMNMLRYPHLNKNACKRIGISPDSIMQLSFQLAYRKAFNSYVGTYESCSTAVFRHGRTETIRPCTKATKKFCEAILQPSNIVPNVNELRAMIKQCSMRHGELTKEAAMGQGFDRHLFALKHIAKDNNITLPDFYETKAYKKINHNIISTSTLSSTAIMAGSFGPVVQDGLGVGYSIQNEECGAIVTSYENGADGRKFIESLEDSFSKIYKILQ